ncbi:DUF4440 domain-containing protein [Paramicrobacterium chengjingii]|uniref:DUF4440 domain-containing protein n=1 Tax=Paramicrobacterium chengjingii TaxID=2769067 RepID=A0ABX6YJB7_9MICO|nr:DUF4440 domain-containing protein [Microbacterium chengjingii]QPZ38868.1 DUF4440 domain-containing protein [Microbacterium chengjingii]
MTNREAEDDVQVRAAEIALLSPETRRDSARVRELLHEDFTEIGRSGRRWTRDEILDLLVNEDRSAAPQTDEWVFTELAAGVVLVTYRIVEGAEESRHSSIWETTSGVPRMRFHQGTRSD